jgi:hypothetical protein
VQRIQKNRISPKRLKQFALANFRIFGNQNHALGQGRRPENADLTHTGLLMEGLGEQGA